MDLDMGALEKGLGNFAGLSALVVALVGGIKMLFPKWVDGKEPGLALVAAYVLALIAKLTGVIGVHWLTIVYLPILVAVAAQVGHDKVLSVIRGNQARVSSGDGAAK